MTISAPPVKSVKLRPPIKCHGGKFYLAKKIIPYFGEHRMYASVFGGGGSDLLQKPKVELEIYNDLDLRKHNLFYVIKYHGDELSERLAPVKYKESVFEQACIDDDAVPWSDHEKVCALKTAGRIEAAANYLIRNRMSRGGMGKAFAIGTRLRGGQPGDANSWDTFRAIQRPAITERLSGTNILAMDGAMLLRYLADEPDALLYLDPPYVHATRTARKVYDYEMTDDQHRELLIAARQCKGRVVISGYDNPLYAELLSDWQRVEFDMPNHSGQGSVKQRRTESLWINR